MPRRGAGGNAESVWGDNAPFGEEARTSNISSGEPRVPISPNVGYATVTFCILEMLTMATSVRGRSGTRSRSTYGSSSFLPGRFGNSRWGAAAESSGGQKVRRPKTGRDTVTVPTAWKGCSNTFQNKINSFKTLFNQTKGPAKFGRPSPTTLNSFANWINKGAIVQTCTAAQVARWAKATRKNFGSKTSTPTTCRNVLWAKFGKNTIKAVAKTKSGSFMVATAPVFHGKPFCFPNT